LGVEKGKRKKSKIKKQILRKKEVVITGGTRNGGIFTFVNYGKEKLVIMMGLKHWKGGS